MVGVDLLGRQVGIRGSVEIGLRNRGYHGGKGLGSDGGVWGRYRGIARRDCDRSCYKWGLGGLGFEFL